jgi:hypothetical protein
MKEGYECKLTPTIKVRGFSLRFEISKRGAIDPPSDNSSPDFQDGLRTSPRWQYYLPHLHQHHAQIHNAHT